ncbi:polysaccharide biosynthesis tyrosine autokinase [Paraburkholderia sediminicola]|uniref:polysaccharide biosynthesis tyrosine autokinase n=1 Tax=Paraburkholderia sediminicola TaxID=458836 RepID=UPI0038BA49C7
MATLNHDRLIESSNDAEVHLSEYLTVIFENWKMIAVFTIASVILGGVYALIARPVYRADAMIQVEDSANAANDALGNLASIFDTKQTAAGEMELIRSRLVVTQTVKDLHLDISVTPRYFPVIGAVLARHANGDELAPPLFGLSRFATGGEQINVVRFDVPRAQYGDKFTLVALKNGRFALFNHDDDPVLNGAVGKPVSGGGQVSAVEIEVDNLVAREGTQFVITRESTLATIDRLQSDLVISEKTKLSGVIGVSLDGYDSARTADIVNAIARAYVQQNVDRKQTEAAHTLTFLDQQLPQLRKELDQAEDRYNAFRNKNGTVDLSEESHILLQQIVERKTKLADLRQQRIEMAQRFTETHPAIVALDGQIASMESEQGSLNKRVSMLPDTEQAALRLLRDVRVDTELYTNFLNNAQQLRVVKAGQVGNVRVVDYAVTAELPVKPKKKLDVALAAILGLVLGTFSAFLRKNLFGGVEYSEEIEQAIGLPVYAVIPHSDAQQRLQSVSRKARNRRYVLATSSPEDVAIEGIRSLRTALEFGLLDAKNNIVVLTGPRPEVGKSFMSVNLAAVLASGGKRVLLIDADMRRGSAHEYFGASRQPGLSDVVRGLDITKAIVPDVLPGLDLLPKGKLPPNPAELLMSERFRALFDELSAKYDLIIVDTPPVLAVTDSTLIGKHAGTTLLVLRHARHPLPEIAETTKRLRNSGVVVRGVLMTDVPQRRIGSGAYYSGYYGYASTQE